VQEGEKIIGGLKFSNLKLQSWSLVHSKGAANYSVPLLWSAP